VPPLVSVLAPTRDRRRFVPTLLALFRAQTWPEESLELVVVDDGEDPVGDLVAAHPRVTYVRLERRVALGEKRNLCVIHARGDLLVHMDDDDYYPPDRVETCARELADAEVVGKSELWVYHAALRRILFYPYIGPHHATAATLAYRRSYWEAHRFPPVPRGEEPGFLMEFSGPLRQIRRPAHEVMLAIQHGGNSVPKRTDCPAAPLPLSIVVPDPTLRAFYEGL
jgi:glycosyltransferase involved in cell wall biosynthesis